MTELSIVPPASYDVVTYKGSELPKSFEPMIYSKWLRALRFGNPVFKHIESEPYYSHYHKLIEVLLKKPDALVKIAALSDDHDVALGFSVSREDVLDFIYVQKDYRRQGIGRKLYPQGSNVFTHFTMTALQIWQGNDRYKHLKFNPHA